MTLPTTIPQFIDRYWSDPVAFVIEVLGQTPYVWQCEYMRAVARGDRRISARSGHRVGKSTVLAWVAIWFMLTRNPFKIAVTAPTTGQLYDAFYAELRRWIIALPVDLRNLLEVKSDRVEVRSNPGEMFLTVATSRAEAPEALQGKHSKWGLLIVDEASGVPDAVFDAAGSSMANPGMQMLLCSNPLRSSGYFFDTFNRLAKFWTNFHISSEGLADQDWINEQAERFGKESNNFRARVLGEFPRGDDDTVIPLVLAQSAVGREVLQAPGQLEVWGLDCARFGSDSSGLCRRIHRIVPAPVEMFHGLDTMQLAGRVAAMYFARPEHLRPEMVNVDVIGIGAGVTDRLREMKLPAFGINVSESPAIAGTYRNLRSELWHTARAWLEGYDVQLPQDDRLLTELTSVRYDYSRGRSEQIQIESKKSLKERMPRLGSPDAADAFVMTFAGRAALASGRVKRPSWNTKLKGTGRPNTSFT